MMRRRPGPRVFGDGALLDAPTQKRAREMIAAIGIKKACERLRMGQETLDAACHGSRVQAKTAQRLRDALDREEPLLARAAS